MNFVKLGSVVASGALLLASAVPAFASTTIKGNGFGSSNTVVNTRTTTTTTVQASVNFTTNNVMTMSSTGGNVLAGNTGGGGTHLTTGDVTTRVNILNLSGVNVLMH